MREDENIDLPGLNAVIGMAVRVPGAKNVDEFWGNLCKGIDSIDHFTDEELLETGVSPKLLNNSNYVKANGTLPAIDRFDANFFGINKREAEITDPQHRLFLECAWEALECSGYNPLNYEGRIGVFASKSLNTYFLQNLNSNKEIIESMGGIQTILGNDRDFLATRLSFIFNLRGPSIVLQSACSSSLSAIHYACQSLNSGESDIVLSGGVSISLPQKAGYIYQPGGIYSIDGKCRAFDENATGTVGGNGVGIVVLKRYSDALEDGDNIYAVIRGSAINNDGNDKVGYTAPGVHGQTDVIEEALAVSRVESSTISYVETHGTGTPLGDPIEVEALSKAFSISITEEKSCAIGSVKTNLGHLDAAAGVIGLIKTTLMLKHGMMVPSLHFKNPNPKINFKDSPFYVNTENKYWDSTDFRRAGVSSFGIGGTNVHVVLEDFEQNDCKRKETQEKLLILSARSKDELGQIKDNLAKFLEKNPKINLNDVAYTLQIGRKHFDTRTNIACQNIEEAVNLLKAGTKAITTDKTKNIPTEIAFLFPGQGTQYKGMAQEIYQTEELFRDTFDKCSKLFQEYIEEDLRIILYDESDTENEINKIDQTFITQPLLFIIEYSLTILLNSWGIKPAAMIGHSLGEYTAACVAGVFSLEDAINIVASRAKLMQKLPTGDMLSVKSNPEKIKNLISPKLSIAVLNTPKSCVVSGTSDEIEKLRNLLENKNIDSKLLKTSHAFHSPMMNDVLDPFYNKLSEIEMHSPQIPFISNLTGTWIKDSEAKSPEYWVKHLRQTVKFAEGLQQLVKGERFFLLEAGPKSLSVLARMQTSAKAFSALPNSLKENTSSLKTITNLIGELWTNGYEIDWLKLNKPISDRRRVPLPSYPFQQERFWVEVNNDNSELDAKLAKPIREESSAKKTQKTKLVDFEGNYEIASKTLKEIIFDLTGSEVSDIDAETTFYQLGVDSLLLIQASQEIEQRLGIEISFQQMLEDYPTINLLVGFLAENLPDDLIEPSTIDSNLEYKTSKVNYSSQQIQDVENIISSAITQLQKSLEEVKNGNRQSFDSIPQLNIPKSNKEITAAKAKREDETTKFVPFRPIKNEDNNDLSEIQNNHLNDLIKKYNLKTRKSKQLIQESRQKHADSRLSLNFRKVWKEMVYPIIGDKSKGSKIWDVDGNEYIDLTMGFGVNLFGHSPNFIVDAINDQIGKGLHLGPQAKFAGEVSDLFCELTGQERVAYTVSGTEAVIIAMRLARTATGKDNIVCFSGSYHGSADAVLVRGSNQKGNFQAVPLAPGVTKESVANTIVLDYDKPESLDIISANSDNIAAIMVEAVQSRRPELQPREFLKQLRKIATEKEIVLIFDEIITGFRLHPKGAQGWFGIDADLSTFGKVIGGGLPIGVVAGKTSILNAIDGGMWDFGNDSYPQAKQTYVAGTFYKHPLGMASMRAVLTHLLDEGPELQESLNAKTDSLVARLNSLFEKEDLPINVVNCASLFRFNIPRSIVMSDLFFYHLINKGIYIWEGRNCFLSTAHTEQDLNVIYKAVEDTVYELKNNGFLTQDNLSEKKKVKNNDFDKSSIDQDLAEESFSLTEGQQQIWLASQLSKEASSAYNESVLLKFSGHLDSQILTKALNLLVSRHEALRAVFDKDGNYQSILAELKVDVNLIDLTSHKEDKREIELKKLLETESQTPFDLINGPLIRSIIIKKNNTQFVFCLTIHHLVIDGWSFSVLLNELKVIYRSLTEKGKVELPNPASYRKFTKKQIESESENNMIESESFWLREFADAIPVLNLPSDYSPSKETIFTDDIVNIELGEEYLNSLKTINDKTAGTTFVTLLTVYNLALHYISKQEDFINGIHTAGQLDAGARDLVGYYVNLLPLRTKINREQTFAEYLKVTKAKLFEIYKHQSYPLGKLIKKLNPPRIKGRSPLITSTFNSFRAHEKESFGNLEMETHENPSGYSRFDLNLNILEWDDRIECLFIFNQDIFAKDRVVNWLQFLSKTLLYVAEDTEISFSKLSCLLEEFEEQLIKNKQAEFKKNRSASLKRITRRK